MKKITCSGGPLQGLSKDINDSGITFGTGKDCDISLPRTDGIDIEARLSPDGESVSLTVESGTEHIQVNGKQPEPPVLLVSGDIIAAGGMTFAVEDSAAVAGELQSTIFKQNAAEAASADMTLPDPSMPAEEAELLKKKHAALGKLSKNAPTGLPPLMEALLDSLAEIIPVLRGSVLLKDESSGELTSEAARNYETVPADTVFMPSRTLTENAMRNKILTITINASQDQRFTNSESVMIQNLQSVICMPLLVYGTAAGVIYLESRPQSSFSQQDAAFCAVMASQAVEKMKSMPRFAALKDIPTEEPHKADIPAPAVHKPKTEKQQSQTMLMILAALLVFSAVFAIGLWLF